MQVSALVKAVDGVTLVAGGEVEVASLADDSRQVKPGAMFVARAVAHGDGRAFIQDAIAKGAVAVLADEGVEPIGGVAWVAARGGAAQHGTKRVDELAALDTSEIGSGAERRRRAGDQHDPCPRGPSRSEFHLPILSAETFHSVCVFTVNVSPEAGSHSASGCAKTFPNP